MARYRSVRLAVIERSIWPPMAETTTLLRMGAQVANLSDKDIVDIAAYLASLPATIGTGHR